MKKIVLFVFISIILICIGCDLSFLQKIDTLQKTSSQTEQTADNAQQDTIQPGQVPVNPETGEDTDDSQSGTSQPGQDPVNPETGEDTDDSQSGTSQPGQVPDNPETGEDTDDSQSGTSQPGQVPDNPETGEDTDNPQQDQNETTVESQNTIDFSYTITGRDITLTPVVSWKGVNVNNLTYFWMTSDDISYDKNPTFTIPEGATATTVTLQIYNEKTLLGEVSKKISISNTAEPTPIKLLNFNNDANHPDKNPQYMYFALQIKGTSTHGTFLSTGHKKNGVPSDAYPRSVQYEHDIGATDRYTSIYAENTPDLPNLGVGYTEATGFGNKDGTSFHMPFYFGDNKCRVQIINGKSSLQYTFANFVVWDTTVDSFLGNWGYPVLIRLPSADPLIITIPMDTYNPSIHKNIALLTVTFNDDAQKHDFKYSIRFDGFEPK
ncbi:MAG: hypothetical protein J6V57_00345 [Spirochaetaceae bacterium]|nr:hypothetical protein [Spirochaetaceae bacterium]